MALLRGGTTTTRQDKVNQQLAFETRHRRQYQDYALQSAKIDPTGSKLYSRRLGGNAHIVLRIHNNDAGAPAEYITCELNAEESAEGLLVLSLNLVCPVCVFRHGRSVGESQMLINQRNRKFSLDTKRKGELWVNPLDARDVYVLAGTITTHESFRCDHGCQTRYRIDDSVLRIV